MPERPETRFAWSGELALAYQVLGAGEPDLLYLQGWASNVELNWDQPIVARFLRGLAGSRRLIVADPRGTGVSERASPYDIWPLESLVEDIGVLLDTVGSERAAIIATNEESLVATMFAATYPERTVGVILFEAAANFLWSPETPWEWTERQFAEQEATFRLPWTRAQAISDVRESMPSFSSDAAFCEWWFRYRLFSEAAGHAIASTRKYKHTDVRPILSSIHVPVLVLHRPNHVEPSWSRSARYLADHIAGASIRELPGSDSMIWTGDPGDVHAAVDDFLDELHREQVELDRVLATVMFTDIVGATEKAAELGDHGWRDLAQRHHTAVRALIGRYRGVEVDTAGDGFFATFDGPARAIRCAQAIAREVRPLGIEVRAGIHTGEVETINGKAGGIAVHIGARIGAIADPSEVLVSRTVIDLVAGAGLRFADRGEHQLKGIPDPWRIYQVLDRHADGA